ncbi:hypothetical protein Ngar_c13610 [Candidatus Nitrososphaera gargensis Ga9.2]|uniref:Terminase large subunit gp17-like C-terminal domain-containing protein n=1 Tax=Nitrososphaera gargensis (strain Ga9.2) TaxID=1237085 RepID=K0IMV8_NITGG|nr:hypothetical protein Ngar_c13610 [Candidatus Nitrososphaera gargensis Ga9.2]
MARYIYGLDPASKNDWFGIVVHELMMAAHERPPRLRAINQMTHTSFDKIYGYLVEDMFKRYPPYYIVIDYSNEKTFSDLLVRLYGKEKVERIAFSNANKLMLKEDGLAIMKQEYKFPNPAKVADPAVAQLILLLVQQLKSEQILQTATGKTTFDHPRGQHNDLAIAWELSIHGCLKFMIRGQRNTGLVYSRKYDYDDYASSSLGYASNNNYNNHGLGSGVPDRVGVTRTDRAIIYPGR